MLPIRDINPRQTTPYVNYALIGANVFLWLLQSALTSSGAVWLAAAYGVVPARISADPAGEGFTVLTSMFMHSGWLHLGGNMLMLHIFGDNVEEAVGHMRYGAFYLASGTGAALAQVLVGPESSIPMVGASGAIAGVLAAYLVLYPTAPILVIFPFFPLWPFYFPAWLVAAQWFLLNLLGGFSSLGDEPQGGVAFFAHIGGFLAGLMLVRPAMKDRRRRASTRWQGWRLPPGDLAQRARSDGSWRPSGGPSERRRPPSSR